MDQATFIAFTNIEEFSLLFPSWDPNYWEGVAVPQCAQLLQED